MILTVDLPLPLGPNVGKCRVYPPNEYGLLIREPFESIGQWIPGRLPDYPWYPRLVEQELSTRGLHSSQRFEGEALGLGVIGEQRLDQQILPDEDPQGTKGDF